MKKITFLTLFTLLISAEIYSQEVVSMQLLGSNTKEEITALFGLPFFRCGADYYKMDYTSVDAKGQPDTLSGLVSIPSVEGATFPLLVYEHGTANCKTCVPSRYGSTGGEEGRVGLLFGGMGYVCLLPDYVGMGDGRGFQTYVHDSTIISASNDMMIAFKKWATNNQVLLNNQLFITGYSQGGYAAMAFYKFVQETMGQGVVTAATCNSGPYSVSGVMRYLILTDSAYNYPAYIPNTYLGMNEYYEIYDSLNDFFKTPYIPDIRKYYKDEITLTELNTRLLDSLITINDTATANAMIIDAKLDLIRNNPNYIINKILRKNDVFRWVPQSPTRIFYCKGDDQVPYMNSVVAIDTMYALGASSSLVKAENLNDTMTHTGCVQPAFTQTLLFFMQYQSTNLSVVKFENHPLKVYPNPAREKLYIEGDAEGEMKLSVWSMNGRKLIQTKVNGFKKGIDISHLKRGMYLLRIQLIDGVLKFQKFVVQ